MLTEKQKKQAAPSGKPAGRKNTPRNQRAAQSVPVEKKQNERGQNKKAAPQSRAAQAVDNRKTNTKRQPQRRGGNKKKAPVLPVRITMLGGLNEIGKNITLFEYGNDAFLIDCGMAFPDEDLLGVDIVLPDFSHVEKNADRIRGIVITHGHEDHIGALPYLLKQHIFPIYATKLTIALIESKLKEHGLAGKVPLHVVKPSEIVQFGAISVEFIHVNHSIPDAVGLGIKTPLGYVIHTGDFKIDTTPIMGGMIDLPRLGEMGKEGVLALLADSTNAERPGYTPSERVVGDSFAKLFKNAKNKRVIIATFSSNLHRIQQIIDAAAADGRKVAISGRSMINYVSIAHELEYLNIPAGVMVDMEMINRYPKDQMTIITTGSQGEPMSALARMAFSEHRQVEVGPDDYIIISATPIPGNEKTVGRVVNELMKCGCDVVYEKMYDVHVSGHACQEELKIIQGVTKPKFFIPVHGEQKHLHKHAQLARSMGMSAQNVMITDIGKVIEITADKMAVVGSVPAGRVMVDGFGVGDVGSIVLRDRRHLGQDGLIVVVATIDPAAGYVVSGPDVVSRGFVYVREAEDLMGEIRTIAREVLDECCQRHSYEWNTMKNRVRDELSRRVFQKTKRSPMILPILMEV